MTAQVQTKRFWIVVSEDCRGIFRNILCSTPSAAAEARQREIETAPHGWYADIHVVEREGESLTDVIGI